MEQLEERPKTGRQSRGAGRAKLTYEQVRELRRKYAEDGRTQTSLAKEYGLHQAAVNCIVKRITYRGA